MTPLRTTVLAAAFVATCCGAATACLDLTPVIYETADASKPTVDATDDLVVVVDSGKVDGDAAHDVRVVDVDNRPPCVRCLTTPDDASPPGCGGEISACLAESKCAATYQCALVAHCFEQPSFRDIINCGLPCAQAAGILTLSDPALTLIYNVATCAQASCNGPCAIGDAAILVD